MGTADLLSEPASAATGIRFKLWRDSFHERFFGSDGRVEQVWQGSPVAVRQRPSSAASISSKVDRLSGRDASPLMHGMEGTLSDKAHYVSLVKGVLAAAAEPNCSTPVGDALTQLRGFRETVEALCRATPQVHQLMSSVMDTYEAALKRVCATTSVDERKTLITTLEGLQAEVLHLAQKVEAQEASLGEMRVVNTRLQETNAEFDAETAALQGHIGKLHAQIGRVCSRVFIDGPAPPTQGDPGGPGDAPFEERSAAYFLTVLQRLCLEIEGLRTARQGLLEDLAAAMAVSNSQNSDLQESARVQGDLELDLEEVRGELADAHERIQVLEADKEDLEAAVAQLRLVGAEHDVQALLAECTEKELSHCREMLQTQLDKRDLRPQKEDKPPVWLPGCGLAMSVPRYLRTKATRVKNRLLSKSVVMQLIRDIWAERARSLDRDDRSTLGDVVADVMTRQPTDFCYSFLDACQRFAPTCADADLFLGVLEGRLPEELHTACEKALAQVRVEMERLSKGSRRVSFDITLKALRAALQINTGALTRLATALVLDRTSGDDIEADPQLYPRLCDAIKRTVLIMSEFAWVDVAKHLRLLAASHNSETLSLGEVKEVLSRRDPHNSRLLQQLSVGAGQHTITDWSVEIDVTVFLRRLREGYAPNDAAARWPGRPGYPTWVIRMTVAEA